MSIFPGGVLTVTMTLKTKPPKGERSTARDRILQAATDIAHDVGPANLSLDAVAARAGVSKGGLLYHFPAKLALLEALVETHLRQFEVEFEKRQAEYGEVPSAVLRSYLDLSLDECELKAPPSSGVLAAMVQNPELLRPIKRFKRKQLDRLKADGGDVACALVLFLAVEGIRSLKLFDMDLLDAEETRAMVDALRALTS